MTGSPAAKSGFDFRRPAGSREFVNSRGFRQHYLEWSGTAPPLILLHPKRSNARHWDFMVDSLAAPNRVLAPDARGHGLSEWPDEGYRVPELAEDVIAFMDALGIGRAILAGGAICVSGSPPIVRIALPRSP